MKIRALSGSLWIFFAVVELFAGIAAASPETYYVSPSGDDRNRGTSSTPFKTIQKAADMAGPGDTVVVKDGVYTDTDRDDYIIRLKKSGTSTAWITFRAENQWGAVLDGKVNETHYCVGAPATAISYVRVEGFEMKGCTRAAHFNSYEHHHVYFYRNRIHDIFMAETYTLYGRAAIFTGTMAHDFTFDSNTFYRIGRLNPGTTPPAPESSCTTPSNYIWNGKAYPNLNTCYNHDHALYLKGSPHAIINNVFYELKSGWAIITVSGSGFTVIGNTFSGDNPGREGQINARGTNWLIENNIFYNDATCGVQAVYDSASGTIRNNLFYPNITIRCGHQGTWTMTGNIVNQEPRFVDAQKHDFRLRSNSPAIDKGVATNAPSYDYDRKNRPQGAGYDIGAYEYMSAELPSKKAVIDH